MAVPVDVVLEVSSEDEQAAEKCRLYAGLGIGQIFCFEPQKGLIFQWSENELRPVHDVKLLNGFTIAGERIWREFETDISR